jgi:dipeptidyl aminopeptidase/acylaminoacyl peptidase
VNTGGRAASQVLRRFGVFPLVLGIILDTSVSARPFTVVDDISLQVLHEPCATNQERVVYSPNKLYFFVSSTRGGLDADRVEDAIRIYSVADVAHFLQSAWSGAVPEPVWVIERGNPQGPVISSCRWTADSMGIAFLERSKEGDNALFLAQLSSRQVHLLSLPGQLVGEFDVRDSKHYVYGVAAADAKTTVASDSNSGSVAVAGRSLPSLLIPETVTTDLKSNDISAETASLWAATDGEASPVSWRGVPVTVSNDTAGLALSPDGHEVATAVPLEEVPREWETRYPPPVPDMPRRIHSGAQDPHSYLSARHYVRIDLRSGAATTIGDGPTGADAGWTSASVAKWSADGSQIALTASYWEPVTKAAQRPCVTVMDLKSNRRSCVFELSKPTTDHFSAPWAAEFVQGNPRHIRVTSLETQSAPKLLEFYETASGRWREMEPQESTAVGRQRPARIWIEEGLSQPPLLMASHGKSTRVLWNPNPQLKDIELGQVSAYRWQDASGRRWTGGLYQPASYRAGERYPLVIQTHGFHEDEFNPAGIYTTANAAQALAGLGFFVLQVPDNTTCDWGDEAKCAIAAYDSAVKQLDAEGKVDPQRVGIEGFSWTCLYVTQALTSGATRYRAASITDGVMWSYMLYLSTVDNGGEWPMRSDRMFGRPMGANLTEWISKSPIFNLDRSQAALQVVALGKQSLLNMWEPYAVLHYLHRPVDAVLINTSEHVLTNPKERFASQSGEVDWFLFWLKDDKRTAPVAAAGETAESLETQYSRWEVLKALKPSS